MSFLRRVAGLSLRDRLGCPLDASLVRCSGHVPPVGDPGKTQDTLERLCLSTGLGTPGDPPDELEEVAGEREVWASLLRLLPPRPDPG
ncbi:hypothetical protein D4764_08G0005910 [Takifugu flavidus]|uniref:Uncharacterized protein n=1 Tax=Takifugu flavidus TaxID=433684 RepID=A0A5C6MMX9_9TELE|nr:hypothetical protein D4764_08G0005910 [Takifugu flavidus]